MLNFSSALAFLNRRHWSVC